MSYSVFAIRQSPKAALATIKADDGWKAVPKNIKAEIESALRHYAAKGVECVDVQCYGQDPHLASYDAGYGANAHLAITIQLPEHPALEAPLPKASRNERRAATKKAAKKGGK